MTQWGPLPRFNAGYYKRREQEWRDLSHRTADTPLQQQILWIADEYASLAERARAWERDQPDPDTTGQTTVE